MKFVRVLCILQLSNGPDHYHSVNHDSSKNRFLVTDFSPNPTMIQITNYKPNLNLIPNPKSNTIPIPNHKSNSKLKK